MGDPEQVVGNTIATAKGVINTGLPISPGYNTALTGPNATMNPMKLSYGCAPGYLISIPGFLRILNIVFGAIALGLWIPGYEHEFLGDRVNLQNGDTERGYGNGWKREPLNQFVLAAIVICLIASIILLIGLVVVKQATVDWNRLNKLIHLALSGFLLIAAICAIFGVWYFNENCCHVSMDFEGAGLTFSIATDEGNYVRHCYCYLTKYLNLGDQYQQSVKETTLYDATKRPDVSGFDHRWTFAAHDANVHIAAVFIIFINAIFYFLGFLFSKAK